MTEALKRQVAELQEELFGDRVSAALAQVEPLAPGAETAVRTFAQTELKSQITMTGRVPPVAEIKDVIELLLSRHPGMTRRGAKPKAKPVLTQAQIDERVQEMLRRSREAEGRA